MSNALMSPATRVEPIAYSIDDCVQATGLSRFTIKRLIAEGRLISTTIGRRRLIPRAALEKLVTEGAA